MLTFSAKLNNEQSGTSTPQIRLRDLHKKNFFSEWIENGILGAVAKLQKKKRLLVSSCRSVCLSAWNNSAGVGKIFIKFDIWEFFESLWTKFKSH